MAAFSMRTIVDVPIAVAVAACPLPDEAAFTKEAALL